MLIRLERLLEELRELPEDELILVEGKRDVEGLKALGITAVAINSLGSYEDVARTLHEAGIRRVIILTDRDRKGEEIRRKLLLHLHNWEIGEDQRLRREFFTVLEIVEVEEVLQGVERILGGEIYGKDLRRFREVSHSRKARGKGSRGQARRYRSRLWANGGIVRR